MSNKDEIERIKRESYDLQMQIADDIERFGNKEIAAQCRNEAFLGIVRIEYWNSRLDVLFH